MNEENISSIIGYFQNNGGQSNETLIKNLLRAGFTDTDIREACRRMGFQTPKTVVSRLPVIVITVIILLFIVGVGSFAALTFLKTTKNNQVSPSPTIEILPSGPASENQIEVKSAPLSSDPIEMMKSELNTKNFKVIVKNIQDRTTLFVLDHGKFVRFEDIYPQANQYAIFKSNDFYLIDNQNKKSYRQPADSSNGRFFYQSAEILFIPYFLITAMNDHRITWQELSESHWKALWKTNSGNNIVMTAEVNIQNHLPTIISMQRESGAEPYEKYSIEYEELTSVDNYTTLPPDYTLEELK